jgi:hypothetical protein
MSTQPRRPRWLHLILASVALALLLLTGCLEQHLLWSPDGKRAAVIDKDSGLFLCDIDGKLSPPLVPDVFRVAWLSDSQQLILARKHSESKWTPIARAMGQQSAAALVAQADAFWQKLQTGTQWSSLWRVPGMWERRERDEGLIKIYLHERYGESLHVKLDAGDWDNVAQQTANIYELVMARIDGDTIITGTQLHEGIDEISDCRVSPGDKAVAFVTQMAQDKDEDGRLWVVQVNTSTPVLVAERVAFFPDWTADARSLVYLQSSGASATDDLRLGTLVQRKVLNPEGKIEIESDRKELGGWIFSSLCRIRCLRDGRIVFNAAEITLPVAAEDFGDQREQLFALDLARQSTLVRLIPRKHESKLPQSLAFFEVSPDEQQVLCGWVDGTVGVITLATGELKEVQEAGENSVQGAPVWRKAGEFTYTRRTGAKDGKKPARAVEVVLGTEEKDGHYKETVLSQTWPDAMLNALVSEK